MKGNTIGSAARHAGVSPTTIRYYERVGLLTVPPRSAAGYRLYGQRAIDEVRFIRRAQALGLTLADVRAILRSARAGATPCPQVVRVAERHLVELDERIRELQAFRAQVAAAVAAMKQSCGFTPTGLCDLNAAPEPRGTRVMRIWR